MIGAAVWPRWTIVAVWILAAGVDASVAQMNRPEVNAVVSSETAWLGESFEYQIRVSDIDQPDPQFKPPDGVDVVSLGPPSVESQMAIVNGAVSSSRTFVFRYRVTPDKAGPLTLPAPVVEAGGRRYTGRRVVINVIAPTPSPLVRISAVVDRDRVFPMQKFGVELRVDVRELDRPWSVISPVSSRILNRPPALLVPWLADARLPEDVVPIQALDTTRWLARNGSGFTLNGLRRFGLLTFLPDEEKIRLPADADATADDSEVTWFRYVFRRSFVARKAGEFSLGRASLRGGLVESIANDRGSLSSVFVVTDPVTIEVTPLPLDGRPKSWVGVIGDLDVESRITPTTARVGEPLTLTLILSGTGTLADAFPPDLSLVPAIAEHFRVYEATSKPTRQGRTFTYSLRAKQNGRIEFPPVELSWFDPDREEYVTGRTSPIPLSISDAAVSAPPEVHSGSQSAVKSTEDLAANESGIRANLTAAAMDAPEPRLWFQAWAGMVGLFAVAWVLLGRDTTHRKAKHSRRRAVVAAGRTLDEGLDQLANDRFAEGAATLRSGISHLLSAVSNSQAKAEGLTVEELTEGLATAGFEQDLVEAVHRLLLDCDAARYGGGEARVELGARAREAIERLVADARKMGSVSK